MSTITALPVDFLYFWYIQAPLRLFSFFSSFNKAFLQFFSFSLLLRTFFKPLKNEYREGLVGFSIGMGVVVKSFFILFCLVGLLFLAIVEMLIVCAFIAFPILTVATLFHS